MADFERFFSSKVRTIAIDSNGVVALYKPCGTLSMPNKAGICPNALLCLPYDPVNRCYELPNETKFFLLNRLDSATSGVLLGCLDENLAREIRNVFRGRQVEKEYRALVKYCPVPDSGSFIDRLEKENFSTHVRVKKSNQKRVSRETNAETEYVVMERFEKLRIDLAILQLKPITGRTHQLRVQCALRKMPIVGDKIYGDFKLNRSLAKTELGKRLYLQSCAIGFEYRFNGALFRFDARIPNEF